MITRKQIETFFINDRKVFQNKNVDYILTAVTLLRNKIPYEVCRNIIGAAEHDIIYLCDLEQAMPYLTEQDLDILADCNVHYEEDNDCFALFV